MRFSSSLISRGGVLALAALAAACAHAPEGSRSEGERAIGARSRPNVLFISADDLNNDLGCYGHSVVRSPHIDALAARGVRFDRAYAQTPWCNPSRASVLTGRRPDSIRVNDTNAHFRHHVPDLVTLPQHFRNHGYLTARVGKVFHYHVPRDIGTDGLDDPASWEIAPNPLGVDRKEESRLTNYTPQRPIGSALAFWATEHPDEEHTDGMSTTAAIRIMEQNRDRPFFLAVGYFRPHAPFVAPKSYFELYDASTIPVPDGPLGYLQAVPPIALFTRPPYWDLALDRRREIMRAYYATISMVDAQVGRLMAALDRLGITNDTIVVFWSDHGYHLGRHGQWMKQTLFEESARVPLIIAAPGASVRGQSCARPVELLDLYPTLVDLAGLPTSPGLEGTSLRAFLENPAAPSQRPAFTQIRRARDDDGRQIFGRSVRTERWRYTEWDGGRLGRELYDYDNDPGEIENLARRPEYAGQASEMARLLAGNTRRQMAPGVPGAHR